MFRVTKSHFPSPCEVVRAQFSPGSTLVIASDGIWEKIPPEDLAEFNTRVPCPGRAQKQKIRKTWNGLLFSSLLPFFLFFHVVWFLLDLYRIWSNKWKNVIVLDNKSLRSCIVGQNWETNICCYMFWYMLYNLIYFNIF